MNDEPGPDDEKRHQTAEAVAQRCLALVAVLSRVHDTPRDNLEGWIEENGIGAFLSVDERLFIADPDPQQQARVDFSWRAEALAALLWALGGINTLEPLNEKVDLDHNEMFLLAARRPPEFIARALLRPAAELADAEQDLYHQHWRVRDAQLFRKAMPPELDPGIVYERRYALSWLVGWGSDWDRVPTDT